MRKNPTPNNRPREAAVVNGNAPRRSRVPGRERLSVWREQHFYSLLSSLGRLSARPWSTLLTVFVMGLALTLLLLFFLMLDNARQLSGGLVEAREVTVFLKPALDAQAAEVLVVELQQRTDVEKVILRTAEQGLAEFKQLSGAAEALDILQSNPLPNVLVLTPRQLSSDTESAFVAELKLDPRVDLVQYDAAWRNRLSAILSFGERIVGVLAVVFALATLLVLGNTIRVDIQGQAEEIAVMQLMGASNGFVRRPFLYAGLWYGFLAGVIALLATLSVELALSNAIDQLLVTYEYRFELRGLELNIAIVIIAASSFLGWLGAYLASSRHLAEGQPQNQDG